MRHVHEVSISEVPNCRPLPRWNVSESVVNAPSEGGVEEDSAVLRDSMRRASCLDLLRAGDTCKYVSHSSAV